MEQIAKNVEGVNAVAQESAAAIEQIAKASENLNQLTENLQDIVQQFKISGVNGNGENYMIGESGKLQREENQLLIS
jgi:hypothetical protein